MRNSGEQADVLGVEMVSTDDLYTLGIPVVAAASWLQNFSQPVQ